MYEDYLEEFIFKTAKLIAQKLFGKSVDEKNDNDVDESSTAEPSQSDDLNENADTKTRPVDGDLTTNDDVAKAANENDEDTKNDETDEQEFEILEKQKPSSDTVNAEKTDETDYGE